MKTHTRWLVGAFTAAMALGGASGALAQVPKVEISGDFGGFSAPGGKAVFTPATRVTVAINPRFAIESGFDSIQIERDRWGSSQTWIYGVQVKQTLKTGREPGSSLFITYGAAGAIQHEHRNADRYVSWDGRDSFDIPEWSETEFVPPIAVTFGLGGQKMVAKYLAIRADVQLLAVPALMSEGAGAVRFAAGVSVPIGGYKR